MVQGRPQLLITPIEVLIEMEHPVFIMPGGLVREMDRDFLLQRDDGALAALDNLLHLCAIPRAVLAVQQDSGASAWAAHHNLPLDHYGTLAPGVKHDLEHIKALKNRLT